MNFTEWFVVGTGIIWLAYDVYVVKVGKSTESQVIRDWGQRWTYFPFVGGFLCGHWWFNDLCVGPSGWMFALPMIVALAIWDIAVHVKGLPTKVWYRYPGLWIGLGIPVGAFLWGQSS